MSTNGTYLAVFLSNKTSTITRMVYDRSRLLAPMLEALQARSDHVESLNTAT